MEQPARNVVGPSIRRLREKKLLTQQRLAVECARLGFDLTRGTLAKIEASVRAASDIEVYVIACALRVPLDALFPTGLLKRVRDGQIAPFHMRRDRKNG